MHAPTDALNTLKHALTRAHGPSCPFFGRPRQAPTATVLAAFVRASSASFASASAARTPSVLASLRSAAPIARAGAGAARGFASSARQDACIWEAWKQRSWAAPGEGEQDSYPSPHRREKEQEKTGWGWGMFATGNRTGGMWSGGWASGKSPSARSKRPSSERQNPHSPPPPARDAFTSNHLHDYLARGDTARWARYHTSLEEMHRAFHAAEDAALRAHQKDRHASREPPFGDKPRHGECLHPPSSNSSAYSRRVAREPVHVDECPNLGVFSSSNNHAYSTGDLHSHAYGHTHSQHRGDGPDPHARAQYAETDTNADAYARLRWRRRPSSHSDFASSSRAWNAAERARCDGVSWFWSLLFNERRRRDPGKRRHFRHVMRSVGIEHHRAEHGRAWNGHGRECRMQWREHCRLKRAIAKEMGACNGREVLQKVERVVARSRAQMGLKVRAQVAAAAARQMGAGSSSSWARWGRSSSSSSSSSSGSSGSQGRTGGRSGPFDFESFRTAYWYGRHHARDAAFMDRHKSRPRYRHVDPQGWIRFYHARARQKIGFAYFTGRYSPDAKKSPVSFTKGMRGGKKVYLGKAKVEDVPREGLGEVNNCYLVRNDLYRNELTARLAARSATRLATRTSSSSSGGSGGLFATSPLAAGHLISSSSSGFAAATARAFSTSLPSRAFSPIVNAAAQTASQCGHHLLPCPSELGLYVLLTPLAGVLKSSAMLNVLSLLTRLSLTLLPLSLRGKLIHTLRTKYASDPSSLASSLFGRHALDKHVSILAQPSSLFTRWNALVGFPLLVLTPVVLLALVALASLERTPVTGRWRIVMLSPAEEADLVSSILVPSAAVTAEEAPVPALTQEGTTRDWVHILRGVLSLPDEGVSPSTGRRLLLGGEVLDPRDWRVRWAEAVLRALEKGGEAALVNGAAVGAGAAAGGREGVLSPPPTRHPLAPRLEDKRWRDELLLAKHLDGVAPLDAPAAASLHVEYDLLVVDRPDANAFSFGFGPERAAREEEGRRGVIVVYTGFIDEILGRAGVPLPLTPPASAPSSPSSSASRLFPSLTSSSSPAPSPAAQVDPIAAYLTPAVLPTQEQTKALAVLLSHELAHLCLDHTLEAYASTNLLVPHLARLGSDVLRTVLYPLTFLLGPFLNDALGRSLHEGALGGFGVLGQAVNSCESRKLESEADRVALRLLAGSGIDPHFALSFWEDRLSTTSSGPSSPPSLSSSSAISASSDSRPALHPVRLHSHAHPHSHSHAHLPAHSQGSATGSPEGDKVVDGLLRSHPVDEERVEAIKLELAGWERYWQAAVRVA
ncbi:hypothetical protein JCM10207_005948 [Rhodosporidiobolus poonsookiae]